MAKFRSSQSASGNIDNLQTWIMAGLTTAGISATLAFSLLASVTAHGAETSSDSEAVVENEASAAPLAPAAPTSTTETKTRRSPSATIDLEVEIRNLQKKVEDPAFNGAACPHVLGQSYTALFNATPKDFAPDKVSQDEMKRKTPELMALLFQSKLLLRQRIFELETKKEATPECVAAARTILRAGRYLEDVLGQFALGFPQGDAKHPKQVFSGGTPWMTVNPSFPRFELKSGDVMLSRGDAFTSAAIARLATVDSQFSHLTIYHIDDKTGVKSTIEAHIEIGSVVLPADKYVNDGKVRAVVFRYKDPTVAHRAATMIRDRVLAYKKKTGHNIPYDFKMDETESSEVFCSELVQNAFQLATKNAVVLPEFKSTVQMNNLDFIRRLGVNTGETFMPADIELDPRFDLVAEWRDDSRIGTNHVQDAVLTSMYDWMERYNYVMYDTAWTKIESRVVHTIRPWPLFSTLLKDKFPTNMSTDVLKTVTTLNRIAGLLSHAIEVENEKQKRAIGFELTPKEMAEKLEEIRLKDLQLWKNDREHATFHHLFHAKDS